jgi:hypothetical protein
MVTKVKTKPAGKVLPDRMPTAANNKAGKGDAETKQPANDGFRWLRKLFDIYDLDMVGNTGFEPMTFQGSE